MTVLVLAADFDITADLVVSGLTDRDVLVCRINTAWFPAQLSVRAELRGGQWYGVLQTPHRSIELEEIHAVLYRSPEAYRFPPSLSPAERHHANLEAKYGLGGILASLPARWVNHPSRLANAAYKPRQLVWAAACGLTVSDTLITNVDAAVTEFAEQGRTVTKMLGASSIWEEGTREIGFTRLVTERVLADLRSVDATTHLFQRWVSKSHEARTIVIGNHITSAAIHAGNATSYVDFRADYDANTYELIDTPPSVITGIQQFMSLSGLLYAAFDFVVSPDGTWTFLEANATGQYGFIERHTGAPLTSQLVDLLARAKKL